VFCDLNWDCVEVNKVANGFVIKFFNYERNEESASIIFVEKTLETTIKRITEELPGGVK